VPDGKRPFVRPSRRWKDNIKMDHQEMVWGSVDWVAMAQERESWRVLGNEVMTLRIT